MRLRKNTIHLVVLTSYQGSIDTLLKRVEDAVTGFSELGPGHHVEASITKDERAHGCPGIGVTDPPRIMDFANGKEWLAAMDKWRDTLPLSVEAFDKLRAEQAGQS